MSAENPRFLFTVVCDDVRQETGNKMSMMGIYEQTIVFPGFPAAVPRLCFVMKARTPASAPFERLTLLVRRDEEVVVEAELTESQLAMAAKENSLEGTGVGPEDAAEHAILLTAVMVVSPMVFEKPCRLFFRAVTESEELRGGSLLVTTGAGIAELKAARARVTTQ
ncbi:MAG: hypothetical protein QY320_00310 [Gammaproteobacteria bacterium]|nr:MAG: hypothetical protein QY320_00310 [Gammaproteobacteria bacterium]